MPSPCFRFRTCLLRHGGAAALWVAAISVCAGSTTWDGTLGNWQADGPDPHVVGVNTDALAWGVPIEGTPGPSMISYFPYEVDTGLVLSGAPFAMGRIEYFNGRIELGTGILSATLFLSPSSDDEELDVLGAFQQRFFTESTPNTEDPRQSADYLFFTNYVHDPLANEFFNVFEQSGASADIWARLDFLPLLGVQSAVGAANGGYQLAILGFAGVAGDGFLTDNPVPEPGAFGLLLAAGAGIAWSSRQGRSRRRNPRSPRTGRRPEA